jgi:hypothetical protein
MVVPRRSLPLSKSPVGQSVSHSNVVAHAVDAGNSIDNDVSHIGELVTINAVSPFCTVYRELDVNGTTKLCKIDPRAETDAMSLKPREVFDRTRRFYDP